MQKNNLSYLAGLIAADGHISKDNGIEIYIKDKKFVKLINKKIKKISKKPIKIYNGKGCKKLIFFDNSIIKQLITKYNLTKGKKCNKLIFPNKINKIEKINFIRGFVDGDGSIYIDKRKRYNKIYFYPRIEIASQSKNFLKSISNFLNTLGITCGKITKKTRCFRFRIYSKNVILFLNKIGFNHPKKILSYPIPPGVEAAVQLDETPGILPEATAE